MKVLRKKHNRVGTKRGVKAHVMETGSLKKAITKFGWRAKTTVGVNMPNVLRRGVAALHVLGESKAHHEAGNHRLAAIAKTHAKKILTGARPVPPIGKNKADIAYFVRKGVAVNKNAR